MDPVIFVLIGFSLIVFLMVWNIESPRKGENQHKS